MRAPGARSAASTPGRTVPNLSRGSINSPDIAANLGVAELELRQYSAAATHLAYALENLLPSTSVDQKAALEASFQQALQHVGVLELSLQPQDATLTIDSRPAQPVAGRLYLDPGTRKLLASAPGHQTLQDFISIKAGETKQAEITLQPDPQAQTPPTSGEPGTLTELEPTDSSTTYPVARKKPSWVPVIIGGAVTAVAAGVYVGFRLRAEDAKDDAERLTADATEQFGQHPCSLAGANSPECADIEKASDRADSSARIGNIALIAGGVALAATATFAVINLWPSSERTNASLSIGPNGFNLKGTF